MVRRAGVSFRAPVMLCLVAFAAAGASAQFIDTAWTRTYGGAQDELGLSVIPTGDGGYAICGWTGSFGAGGDDAFLLKTDASGGVLWQQTYGGVEDDNSFSVRQTTDGGFILAGGTYSYGAGYKDIYVVRTDPVGDTLWTGTYGGAVGDDWACSIQPTADHGYIICGTTRSFGHGGNDVYIVKIDSLGDTVWTRALGGPESDAGSCVAELSDGGYVVLGMTGSFGAGFYDFYLIKLDTLGDTVWTRTYGGTENDCGYAIWQTLNGGAVAAGMTCSRGTGGEDVWVLKLDAAGDTVWTTTYGGEDNDRAYSVCPAHGGGYLVAGYTYSFGAGRCDVYFAGVDSTGDTLWTKTYGGEASDYSYSVQQTQSQGYVAAGWTSSFGAGGDDVYLLRIESGTGVSEGNPIRPFLPTLRVEPNLFRTVCEISVPDGTDCVEVFDVNGRLMCEVPCGTDGSGQVAWQPGESVGAGVYLVRARTGEASVTKRVVYLR